MIPDKKILIVITGPTASGKTNLAISLAERYKTEIISFDSRQFYSEMNIGTAKPHLSELEKVRHHFIGHLSVYDNYSAGKFANEADAAVNDLFKKHDKVIAVGGSGLFLRAWLEGLDSFPVIDAVTRDELNELYNKNGIAALQQLLKEKDPVYYNEADINNPRRLLRALEVTVSSGMPYSSFRNSSKKELPFAVIKIGIDIDREKLYERINIRVDEMMGSGLLEEAKGLYSLRRLNPLQTVGYSELFDYFDKKYSLEEAIDAIKQNTRNYAKRQMTWFRKEEGINWVNDIDIVEIIKLIES